MEILVSRLLDDFEKGRMTRRELVRRIALAAAATASAPAVLAAPVGGFKTVALDHISFRVADYRRTRDFYADLMGMRVSNDDGARQCQLHIGEHGFVIARNHRQADAAAKPLVDHIAYKVDDWDTDRVKAELERRGLKPRLDTGGGRGYASFHVADPDGFDLQISGDPKPGDSIFKEKK